MAINQGNMNQDSQSQIGRKQQSDRMAPQPSSAQINDQPPMERPRRKGILANEDQQEPIEPPLWRLSVSASSSPSPGDLSSYHI